ncbi:MAG: cytochrome c biogenesis protein CcdA [Pseudomonadota bacterium]|nr:cytochrome c biogenesis protein CcdA [Pseudomonadota bacterium]
MELSTSSYGLSLLAGIVSTLSPCVLPIIPLVLAGALGSHRRGPWALSAGLALSFAVIGTTVAASGAVLGVPPTAIRAVGAALLALFGVVLLSPALQARSSALLGPLGGVGQEALQRFQPNGLGGQFMMGLLLGLVWSPCVGPTLGGAVALASQGRDLGQIAALMAVFGMGASLPLLLLGQLSQDVMRRWRGHMLRAGQIAKGAMGIAMILVATSILSGFDKPLEGWLSDQTPDWLTDVTTRF